MRKTLNAVPVLAEPPQTANSAMISRGNGGEARESIRESCGQKLPTDSRGGVQFNLSGEAVRNAEASVWSQRNSDLRQRVETGNDTLAAQKPLPDPWLFDSTALLREIARCRETALAVPITNPNATHFGIQLVVSALWTLEQNIRYLLHLHKEGQRSFRRQQEQAEKPTRGICA